MPLYEYHCTACDENTEILQKMSDEPEKNCPNCHKESLTKQVSAAGFQLKGTGWYVTDFKNKPAPAKTENTTTDKPAVTKPTEKTD